MLKHSNKFKVNKFKVSFASHIQILLGYLPVISFYFVCLHPVTQQFLD